MLMDPQKQFTPDCVGFGVDIIGVKKRFGRTRVLENLNCQINPGKCMALLGPNGAGKTTLFKLILGLTSVDSGQILVDNVDPTSRNFLIRRNSIGFLPENVQFYDMLTGIDVLRYFARLKNVNINECELLLKQVGLDFAAKRPVRTYSKGMRQRLGLAQALLGSPKLLLLDEPTTGLDPNLKEVFFNIIRTLKKQGVTIILSSHAPMELQSFVDLYAILSGGEYVALGTIDQLRKQSRQHTRIRLQFTDDTREPLLEFMDKFQNPKFLEGNWIQFECNESERSDVMRTLVQRNLIQSDIEIQNTNIDDLYRHFTDEKGK